MDNKYRLLIVEDNINLLREWKKILEDEGYLVDMAENGKVALELWQSHIYDLVLVDLRLPEVDGREVINAIKASQPHTQIIIISGQGNDDDLIDAIKKNVYDYISKPAGLDEIIQAISKSLQNRDPVLISLEQLVKKRPDESILLIGGDAYSPRQIYDEVRKMTPLGKQYYEKTLSDFITPMTKTTTEIFLSHASQDEDKAKVIYQKLSNEGFSPWMASIDLLPGENWKRSIQKAIRECDFVLVCLTANSINKSGYIQKEIKSALEIFEEKPNDEIFLIPVRLEECEVHEHLKHLHRVDLYRIDGWDRLISSIDTQMKRKRADCTVKGDPKSD